MQEKDVNLVKSETLRPFRKRNTMAFTNIKCKGKTEYGNDWGGERAGVKVVLSYISIVDELATPNARYHVPVVKVIVSSTL